MVLWGRISVTLYTNSMCITDCWFISKMSNCKIRCLIIFHYQMHMCLFHEFVYQRGQENIIRKKLHYLKLTKYNITQAIQGVWCVRYIQWLVSPPVQIIMFVNYNFLLFFHQEIFFHMYCLKPLLLSISLLSILLSTLMSMARDLFNFVLWLHNE